MSEKKILPKHRLHLNSPVGRLCIEDDGEALTSLYIDRQADESRDCGSEILLKAKEELLEYFAGERFEFDIPLRPSGTDFQLRVWSALRKIPYGSTASYRDIADMTGNRRACRAVGGAIGKNPIMIIVPCHRIIGRNGSLVGFSAGLEVKKLLLELEERHRGGQF